MPSLPASNSSWSSDWRSDWSSDLIDHGVPATAVASPSHTNSAYLFHGPLRAQILWTNEKDNAVHESESVPQHELFHFPVVRAAPVRPGQKRPTDFDLAFLFVVSVESRRPDDLAAFAIHGDQRSARFQG